jgi:aryl-phospho-beta-D-glucosidase BglC (GH1 family)
LQKNTNTIEASREFHTTKTTKLLRMKNTLQNFYNCRSRMNFLRFSLIILAGVTINAKAQMTPFQAVEKMTCGINVGRSLELDAGESSRLIKEYYFSDFKTAGFDFVRIPIQWNAHTGATAPYTIDATWMNRVEQVIDWSLNQGLITVINSHHDKWILENNSFTAADLDRFKAIWTQIAERFKDKSENLIFEIANEPNIGISLVDQINSAIIPIIRQTNPTRNIVFGSSGTQMSTLKQAAIPNDPYLIASLHSYIPWTFAGEGIGTWGTTDDIDETKAIMADAAAWADTHNIPLLLGEFSARSSCDATSRVKWFTTHMEEARMANIAPCVWQDFGWFSMYYDSGTAGSWSTSVKNAVVAKYHEPAVALTVTNGNELIWTNKDADYQSITIERKVGLGTYQTIATLAGSAESYLDETSIEGTIYVYRVVSTFSNGQVGYSFPSSVYEPIVVPIPVPSRVEAENYSDMYGVVATATNIGMIAPGDWVEYVIDVAAAGTYKLDFNVATTYSTAAATISIDGGASLTTFVAPNTGNWAVFSNKSINVALPAGIHTLRIDFTVLAFKTDYINITLETTNIYDNKLSYNGLTVYPNPVCNELQILNADPNSTIEIFNVSGKMVLTKKLNNENNVINVCGIQSGLYMLKAKGNTNTLLAKFIKK